MRAVPFGLVGFSAGGVKALRLWEPISAAGAARDRQLLDEKTPLSTII